MKGVALGYNTLRLLIIKYNEDINYAIEKFREIEKLIGVKPISEEQMKSYLLQIYNANLYIKRN